VLEQLTAHLKHIGPRAPAYATAVSLLGLFAGLLGSLYADA
jgi:hypothetical protein